jgi:hypothetical protein
LQRELEALVRVGKWVREAEPQSPGSDLWDAIALRLPAIDARRAEVRAGGRSGLGWLVWPGAVVSAVLAAVAFVALAPPAAVAPPRKIGVVRWLDSGPRDVMVLEPAPDTTIVWVIGAPGRPAARKT